MSIYHPQCDRTGQGKMDIDIMPSLFLNGLRNMSNRSKYPLHTSSAWGTKLLVNPDHDENLDNYGFLLDEEWSPASF